MRKLYLLALSLSVLSAAAVTVDVPRLSGPSYADREVSGDVALPENRLAKMRVFRLEMTFDATASNNVQVAFGHDTMPADGALSAEETAYIIGWDCGEWFLRPQGLRERYAVAAAVTNGMHTLTAAIRVNAQGVPQSVVFKDGNAAFTFGGLALPPFPDWLTPGWTCLRVTVRGGAAANETVSARFLPDGARIIIR